MKRIRIAAVTVTLLAVATAGCGSGRETPAASKPPAVSAVPSPSQMGELVGVTMPTKSSERWIRDGSGLKEGLEKLGYTVDLQYAQDDSAEQVKQVEAQIAKGAKLLIIASVDGSALGAPLKHAESEKIPVIAYDRLLLNSKEVDYYTSFDNIKVGVQQATSLLTGLGLVKEDGSSGSATGPFEIELFAGSPDDKNATYFFNGAMTVINPYLGSGGKLVLRSGQKDFSSVATPRWDGKAAGVRMNKLLTKTYTGAARVQGVLSPYDGMSLGILAALKSHGYGSSGRPYPVVTGQDAELPSVKSIIAGQQYSTIFKDTRELAKATVTVAEAVLQGRRPRVNDLTTYDNGLKVVPSYVLDPVLVNKDNYRSILVGAGYYTEAELAGD